MNPLKDVKHEKKPLKITIFFSEQNFLAMKKPKNNDPIIETMKLLFINTLKKVAKKQDKRINYQVSSMLGIDPECSHFECST